MLENVRLALVGIWSHKLRSFLTMLGIIIGIASIISIVSTIRGTNEQIKENLIGAGNNNVDIRLMQGEMEYDVSYMGMPMGMNVINDTVKQKIRGLEDVKSATFYNRRGYEDGIRYQDTSLESASVYGVDLEFLKTRGYQVQAGRNITSDDLEKRRKVILIDDVAAQTLFPGGTSLGKVLDIQGEPFTIVGCITKAEAFKPVINTVEEYYMYNQNSNGMVLMPITSWPIVYSFDEPVEVSLMAESTDQMSKVGKQAADILSVELFQSTDEQPENQVSYKAADLLKTVKNLQKVSENTNRQLLWIASISLLVGGIGVMNIMLVSVTERTSEIGLKKALGARKQRILWQFLTEAAVLTSIGGVLGVVFGIVLSQIISKISQTPVSISVPASLLAVVFSMVIGVMFGFLPSMKAADMSPIDALRHE